MGDTTAIAWTDKTFNPWMGCLKVSPGCANCYAETLTRNRMGLKVWGPPATSTRQVTSVANWRKPLTWERLAVAEGRRIKVFGGSLCDWAENHPVANETRPRYWELIRATPHLDWQLLTKRPERILECLPPDCGAGYPNVWLMTSIENMDYSWRAGYLRDIPAVVRGISYEPALGPLDGLDLTGIDWVIYGGESGPGFRSQDNDWPRAMRDKCRASGVAFFHKQSAHFFTERGIELDGEIIREFPTPRQVTSDSATARRDQPQSLDTQAALL